MVPPLVKSAAEFMGGINIRQDFYFLSPGASFIKHAYAQI